MLEPLQVWNLTNCKLRANLAGHQGYINTVTVSPDGSLCASGGKVAPHSHAAFCTLSDSSRRPTSPTWRYVIQHALQTATPLWLCMWE